MTKNVNNLWDVFVGYDKVYSNIEKDEAFSALFTIADHYDGVAMYEGLVIGRFNG